MERLSTYSAATIHEACDSSRVMPSWLRSAWPGARLMGGAFTVRQPGGGNGWIHRAIYEAKPGSILVVSTDEREYGYWGELMSLAAVERGLGGLVIDGGVRDTREIEALGFPVFSSAVCMRGTSKTPLGPGATLAPIRIGHVAVQTGDLVVGDADGVVVVPAMDLAELERDAERRTSSEETLRERMSSGERLIDLVCPAEVTEDW